MSVSGNRPLNVTAIHLSEVARECSSQMNLDVSLILVKSSLAPLIRDDINNVSRSSPAFMRWFLAGTIRWSFINLTWDRFSSHSTNDGLFGFTSCRFPWLLIVCPWQMTSGLSFFFLSDWIVAQWRSSLAFIRCNRISMRHELLSKGIKDPCLSFACNPLLFRYRSISWRIVSLPCLSLSLSPCVSEELWYTSILSAIYIVHHVPVNDTDRQR